jgi:hypothetical protein
VRLVHVQRRDRSLDDVRPAALEREGAVSTSNGLNKRHKRQRTALRRYRIQEVAGSSPASSSKQLQIDHEAKQREYQRVYPCKKRRDYAPGSVDPPVVPAGNSAGPRRARRFRSARESRLADRTGGKRLFLSAL